MEVVIIASDGLWDVFSPDDAVEVAMSKSSTIEAADALVEMARKRVSKDDISVYVLFL